jgi:DNA-binding NtrC family response regulator
MNNESMGILVVDDEFSVRDSLCSWFRKGGYRVGGAENASEALQRLQEAAWDLVLLDIRMPGMDGLELQGRIKQITPEVVIIIITAYASVETAVQALKEGAFDYITKPIDPDQLDRVVRNAVEQRRLRTENIRLREHIEGLSEQEEIVGESPSMRKVLELVTLVAQNDTPVLVRGDSGTGKAHVARAIHAMSRRRYFPFVPVSCGGGHAGALEADLFGHEKGVVFGAQYARKGRLEMADGGTLFLDEIGTIPPNTQGALLSVLDTKQFTCLGGSKPRRVDFRLIGATSQNVEKLVLDGHLRQDFLYRINVVSIDLPPLRERCSDVPLLARRFLQKHAMEMNKAVTDISPEAIEVLARYDWPGNVRELANAIERAVVVSTTAAIVAEDLPVRLTSPTRPAGADSIAEIERAHIARILDRTKWDISRAAEILGIDLATLRERIDKYGLRE